MSDITSVRWLYVKGMLFLALGTLASTLLWLEVPTLKTVVLLALTVWSFARAYYFVFYVIEHYADPSFKFSGLTAFVRYLASSKRCGGPK